MHREDGPALECADGTKQWWRNGKLHREDCPAVERADGTNQWYLNGNKYTFLDFAREIVRHNEATPVGPQ